MMLRIFVENRGKVRKKNFSERYRKEKDRKEFVTTKIKKNTRIEYQEIFFFNNVIKVVFPSKKENEALKNLKEVRS